MAYVSIVLTASGALFWPPSGAATMLYLDTSFKSLAWFLWMLSFHFGIVRAAYRFCILTPYHIY